MQTALLEWVHTRSWTISYFFISHFSKHNFSPAYFKFLHLTVFVSTFFHYFEDCLLINFSWPWFTIFKKKKRCLLTQYLISILHLLHDLPKFYYKNALEISIELIKLNCKLLGLPKLFFSTRKIGLFSNKFRNTHTLC